MDSSYLSKLNTSNLLATENRILLETRHLTHNQWLSQHDEIHTSTETEQGSQNFQSFINRTNSTSSLLDFNFPLRSDKKLLRPPKRTLQNSCLNDVKFNTTLISVKNTLLYPTIHSIKNDEPPSKAINLDYKTDFAFSKITNKSTLTVDGTAGSKDLPVYQFESLVDDRPKEESFFGNVERDTYQEIINLNKQRTSDKLHFLTLICSSLVNSPNFKNKYDDTRNDILKYAAKIQTFDPEFILKAALYSRQELNIRATTNYLLAYAATYERCRVYLRKYFFKAIRLPSDWLEVATLYQTMEDKQVQRGSLPSMLRKVMVEKFQEFDNYQLAKYNKKKRTKKRDKKIENDNEDTDKGDESHNESEEMEKQSGIEVIFDEDEIDENHVFTLKRMIRLLHINKPTQAVLCLLGKNYPKDQESFRQSGLLGIWDTEQAGKRMRLPIPMTWETQLAEKGNKAEVWEKLLDDKKLPYMAMLRNLRNILFSGVSEKHHHLVLKLLSNKNSVINSRQFPLSFYNAYDSVCNVEEMLEKKSNGQMVVDKKNKKITLGQRIVMKKMIQKLRKADASLIPLYKTSLEKAIQISVEHNLDPIPGRTLVLCDLLSSWDSKSNKLVKQNLLLGLMCLFACEDCDLKICNSDMFRSVELENNSILDAVRELAKDIVSVHNDRAQYQENTTKMLESYLEVQAVNQQAFDSVVFLMSTEHCCIETKVSDFVEKYRILKNPNLVSVTVAISGRKHPITKSHPLDVQVFGTSDQLLKFLAAQGTLSQLAFVEQIDAHYKLKPLSKGLQREIAKSTSDKESSQQQLSIRPPLQWRTIRVFISSTFKDMHGERDLLVRYVFPELRARAKTLLVNVHEVDLRWGITEEESTEQRSLELCLTEVARCHYVLGILGDRYGTVPNVTSLPDEPRFDWVRDYPKGASVTELEIFSAALCDPSNARSKAFFYFRDNGFLSEVPPTWQQDFLAESRDDADKISSLKNRIRKSGFEVFDRYPCQWGKEVNNVPVLLGLDLFGQRVLDNLWNAMKQRYGETDCDKTSPNEVNNSKETKILARGSMNEKCLSSLEKNNFITVVHGKPGSGKTSLLQRLVKEVSEKEICSSCFVGAEANCCSLTDVMLALGHMTCTKTSSMFPIPSDSLNLQTVFWDLLSQASKRSPAGQLFLVIDAVDQLNNVEDQKLYWLPRNIDPSLRIILSVSDGSLSHKTLLERQKNGQEMIFLNMEPMKVADRKSLVSSTLQEHRKTLSTDAFNNQMLLLVTKRDAVLPLYLKLACEHLRLFGNYSELSNKIRSLPQSIPQLLIEHLMLLEQWHGKPTVDAAMVLFATSQEGLEEPELQTLISLYLLFPKMDVEVSHLVKTIFNMQLKHIMAPIAFSALGRSIRSLLNSADSYGSKLSLGESSISTAIKHRYLGIGSQQKVTFAHKLLAAYFITVADPLNNNTWVGQSTGALRAMSHHLSTANCCQELMNAVRSVHFIAALYRQNTVSTLVEDMGGILREKAVVSKYNSRKKLTLVEDLGPLQNYFDFLTVNVHTRLTSPLRVIQQALYEPESSVVYRCIKDEVHNTNFGLFEWLTKSDERSPCKMMVKDFPMNIFCCTSNTDSTYLAIGCEDGAVRLLNPLTGNVIRSLIGHGQGISCIVFLSNTVLCCGSYDNTLSVWDVERGFRICNLSGHKRRVTSCCSDLNGKNIISTSWDSTVRIWSAQDGRELSCLQNNKPLSTVAMHPIKELIVTGDFDKTLKLWDLEQLKRKSVFRGHSSSIKSVAFTRNGTNIVSSSLLGEVFVWATYTGTLLVKCKTPNNLAVTQVLYNRSDTLYSCGSDSSIQVWNDLDNGPFWSFKHNDNIFVTAIHIVNLSTVALGYSNGTVFKYDCNTGFRVFDKNAGDHITVIETCTMNHLGNIRCTMVGTETGHIKYAMGENHFSSLHCMKSKITSLAVNYFTRLALAGSASGDIAVFELDGMTLTDELHAHDGPVLCLTIHPCMLSGGTDKKLLVWKLISGKLNLKKRIDEAHADWINDVAMDKNLIATASQDSIIKIWDITTLEVQETLVELGEPALSVDIVDEFVFASGIKGSLAMWTLKGQLLFRSQSGVERTNLVFKLVKLSRHNITIPVKGVIAYFDKENVLEIRKLFNLSPTLSLNGHTGLVTGMAVLGDGVLASVSSDQSIRWWTPRPFPKQHNSKVLAVEWSMKGYLAFSADVYCLKLWKYNNDTLDIMAQISFESECITAAAFIDEEGSKLLCGIHTFSSARNEHIYMLREYTLTNSDLKKTNTIKVKSEITTIEWSFRFDKILIALKSGDLCQMDGQLNGFVERKIHFDWLLSAKLLTEEISIVITTGSVKLFKHNYASVVTDEHERDIISIKDNTMISAHCLTEHGLIVGDSEGCLFRKSHGDLETEVARMSLLHAISVSTSSESVDTTNSSNEEKQDTSELVTKPSNMVHSSSITGICRNSKAIFTSSTDRTIKVWEEDNLKQIGQFNHVSSITCLSSWSHPKKGSQTLLLFGTSSGDVQLMKWTSKANFK